MCFETTVTVRMTVGPYLVTIYLFSRWLCVNVTSQYTRWLRTHRQMANLMMADFYKSFVNFYRDETRRERGNIVAKSAVTEVWSNNKYAIENTKGQVIDKLPVVFSTMHLVCLPFKKLSNVLIVITSRIRRSATAFSCSVKSRRSSSDYRSGKTARSTRWTNWRYPPPPPEPNGSRWLPDNCNPWTKNQTSENDRNDSNPVCRTYRTGSGWWCTTARSHWQRCRRYRCTHRRAVRTRSLQCRRWWNRNRLRTTARLTFSGHQSGERTLKLLSAGGDVGFRSSSSGPTATRCRLWIPTRSGRSRTTRPSIEPGQNLQFDVHRTVNDLRFSCWWCSHTPTQTQT